MCTNTHKSNILVGENSEKLGFSMNHKQIFTKYLQFYMWFYKGIKVNISATTQKKCIVALIYKINPVQITTITAENTEISLNSVPHTIENIQFKNCEKFSPIVKQNLALFSSVTAIVAPILLIALMLSVKRQQLTAHKIYCEGKCTKVLQTRIFLSTHTFMFPGVTNTIGSISQNKHQSNTSNKNVNLRESTKNTNYSLKIHKLSKNGSFFSHKKQCFNRLVQLATTTGCKEAVYNAVQDTKLFFPARWEKHMTQQDCQYLDFQQVDTQW